MPFLRSEKKRFDNFWYEENYQSHLKSLNTFLKPTILVTHGLQLIRYGIIYEFHLTQAFFYILNAQRYLKHGIYTEMSAQWN